MYLDHQNGNPGRSHTIEDRELVGQYPETAIRVTSYNHAWDRRRTEEYPLWDGIHFPHPDEAGGGWEDPQWVGLLVLVWTWETT